MDSLGNEQGLLGLAFHPGFKQNPYFYVNYIDLNGNTVIARFTASGNLADPASEKDLLHIRQPFANHNGGEMTFGPDGYLYMGLGDGGSQGDPNGNGQNTNVLLGKILRVDVDHGDAGCGSLKTSATLAITAPAVVMTLPMFDIVKAIVRRTLNGRPFDMPDRQHIHHRLLDRGWNPWQVLCLLGALCLTTGAAATAATIFRLDALAWIAAMSLIAAHGPPAAAVRLR